MHGKKKWAKRVKTFPQWSETPGSIWFHNVLLASALIPGSERLASRVLRCRSVPWFRKPRDLRLQDMP